MSKFSKLENEFKKRHMFKERELFDFMLKYGSGYRELKMLLWFWELDASTPGIISYARKNGLWEARQRAIAVRKSGHRKFRRGDRSWKLDSYRELARR